MPRRTKTNTKSTSKSRSKSRKVQIRSNSRLTSKINSKNKNSYKSKSRYKSRRKYRGGCKTCTNSPPGTWTSTVPMKMHGGSNPEQISKDIYTHVTNSILHSVA